MWSGKTLFFFCFSTVLFSCKKPPDGPVYDPKSYELEYGELPAPHPPADNPLTIDGVQLGRMLFYEKRLSGNNTQSCASCHRQEHAFSDTNRFSTGIDGFQGSRQAMAVFNLLWNTNGFFWDGRAATVREQSLMPIQDPLEMHETLPNVVEKLSQDTLYTHQFYRAFGSEEITQTGISLALEQFMYSVVSHRSKYDRYLEGTAFLTEEEELGRTLFFGEYNPFFPATSGADCAHCHSGKNFTSPEYMNNGLDTIYQDPGRGGVTAQSSDQGAMKVASLRNIALTPPYMHDGRFSTLEAVVDNYNTGLQAHPNLEPALAMTMGTGLMLTEAQKAALVAFLHTLTDSALTQDLRYASPF